jgi:hypothetical protein
MRCERFSISGIELLPISSVVSFVCPRWVNKLYNTKQRRATNIMLKTLQALYTIVAEV